MPLEFDNDGSPVLENEDPLVEEELVDEELEQETDTLSDKAIAALKKIAEELEEADRPAWDRMVKEFKRLTYMWHGFHRIFWNDIAKDWRTPEQALEEYPKLGINPDEARKVIEIYKAHGESIIAALSASLPHVVFFPKNADNPGDIIAAKGRSKLSQFIQKQNDAPLIFMKAMYTLFNCGIVAAYNYNHESDEYGVIREPIIEPVDVQSEAFNCPECDAPLPSEDFQPCETCGMDVLPQVQSITEQVPDVVGINEEAKSREVIEIWGPLNLKMPPYIRKLADAPYICLVTEHHYSKLQSLFPEIRDKIKGSSDDERSERHYRDDAYSSLQNEDLVTTKRWWLRSFTFNMVTDIETRTELETKFPNGVYFVMLDQQFGEAFDENMVDHWTVTESPLSETAFADPIGQPLAPIQEMVNDLTNLTEETIAYGIGETFADPDVLDFTKYGQAENAPGMVFPASAPPGKALGDGFFTIKAASLSKEVNEFQTYLERMGQFVTGDFPSVFGGFAEGGSKTLGEYQASQTRALQRLSLPWKVVNIWWSRIMGKATNSAKENMKEDEAMVEKNGNSFINIWIKREELDAGEIGQVVSESSDQFPIPWAQQRDLLMRLIELNNEIINQALFHPENASENARILGFPNFYVPGDSNRSKQLIEIGELLKGQPTPDPMDMTGMMMKPSVSIEPDVDEHVVHIETIRAWATSLPGLDAKENNVAGYANVIAHLVEHIFYMKKTTAAPEGEGEMNELGETGEANA